MTTLLSKKHRLAALRPFSSDSVASISAAWDVRMVHESNAIEGNTYTLRQTAMVLHEKFQDKDKPLPDYLELIRLDEAWEIIKAFRASFPLSRQQLIDCYKFALVRAEDHFAGHLSGASLQNGSRDPSAAIIEALNRIIEITEPVEMAASIHFEITRLDPFQNGSGRAARLAMNFILLAAGYPPVSIPTELRQAYYAALEAADSGDFPAWLGFLTRQLDHELDLWLEALEETEDRFAARQKTEDQKAIPPLSHNK